MKSYGADSPKGSALWGNAPYLEKLSTRLPKSEIRSDPSLDITRYYMDSRGDMKTTGGSGLKPTQAYPPELGLEVALLHR
eukprot:7430953-Pyramimonas_sp.AAC.1